MYLLPPFILQNFKRILRSDTVIWCTIFGPKMTHLSWTIFFGTKHYYYFHLPVGPFHWAKFKKNSYSRSKVMRMRHFWTQNGPLAPNKFFFENYLYHFHLLISPFHCAKFQKNPSSGSRVMMRNFWGQNGPFPSWPFHSHLSTCQKSKWDINILVKYWRLKNTEISLAESHFWL